MKRARTAVNAFIAANRRPNAPFLPGLTEPAAR
jgi:hypothetical protein